MTLEEFKKQLETTRKNLLEDGWILTLSIKPEDIIDEEGNEHFLPCWHGDSVACVEKENKIIVISAFDANVTIVKKDGTIVRTFKDRDNTGYVGKCLRKYFKNDEEILSEVGDYKAQFNTASWYGIQLLRINNDSNVSYTWEELIYEEKLGYNIDFILSEKYLRKTIENFDTK